MDDPSTPRAVVSTTTTEENETTLIESNFDMLQPAGNQQNRSRSDDPVGIHSDTEDHLVPSNASIEELITKIGKALLRRAPLATKRHAHRMHMDTGKSPVPSDLSPDDVAGNIGKDLGERPLIKGPGPIGILWDIENCPVPGDVSPDDVAANIRNALREHPLIKGPITMFSAYGDFNCFTRRLREGCQRTGVKLIDVPNGRKDAADKAILLDMFMFALDNPPPSSIMLISGDVDFAPALHSLGQRGYTIILGVPSGISVSSTLCNAGKFVCDWPSMARGEGFISPSEALMRAQELKLAQPGDINGLKGQLVKLLKLSGGCLPFTRVPIEYQKMFRRPLCCSEFGTFKLVSLFKKMDDAMAIDGKANKI
ncbi:hypothetical protein SLEP1_g32449 [Rubroshorea leprosula]|uniref:HTH OST-type domain-containing protein n=1 Tax=Rubroshorea leprosula TaxID=152421 RepID=A0AAV5KDJ7_9ROSI|nr:hypothetical protein SLEP1_g32449 [Rubroshorea leprosula]